MHWSPLARTQRRTRSWRSRPSRALKDRLPRNWPSRRRPRRRSRRRRRRFIHRSRPGLRHDDAGRCCRLFRCCGWSNHALHRWLCQWRSAGGSNWRRGNPRRTRNCRRSAGGCGRYNRWRGRSGYGSRWRRCRRLRRNHHDCRRSLRCHRGGRYEPGGERFLLWFWSSLCRRNWRRRSLRFGLNRWCRHWRLRYRHDWWLGHWVSDAVLGCLFLLLNGAQHIARMGDVR